MSDSNGATATYEKPLAYLIRDRLKLDYLPVVTRVEYEAGGDYQIGDQTWDHSTDTVAVYYTDRPDDSRYGEQVFEIDLESYRSGPDQDGRTGVAGFLDDLVRHAIEADRS